MTRRILPRAQWHRLAGSELEPVWPYLPANADVIVVEEADVIVGCWAVYTLTHVEGVWIHPDHRGKSSVARHLLTGMRLVARALGARAVNTAAVSPDVASMLRKLGAVPLPGEHFALKVGD
jgi:hypothetical protein